MIKINIQQRLTPDAYEKLENNLLKFFTEQNIIVSIYNNYTGNTNCNREYLAFGDIMEDVKSSIEINKKLKK